MSLGELIIELEAAMKLYGGDMPVCVLLGGGFVRDVGIVDVASSRILLIPE